MAATIKARQVPTHTNSHAHPVEMRVVLEGRGWGSKGVFCGAYSNYEHYLKRARAFQLKQLICETFKKRRNNVQKRQWRHI